MNARLWPGLMAILFGTALLIVVLVPIIAANYRRYGKLSGIRIATLAAFAIYAASLVTYTMLPLPEPGSYDCAAPRFTPGASVRDIFDYDVSSLRALATNPGVLQIALNVLLFLPLGFFTRRLWGRGIVSTTLIGAAISLAIETSQLTGLWGIYPCAYRLFDVDDLIVNTLGALLGALLAALLRIRVVAPRGQLGPRPVGLGRRLLGMLSDLLMVGGIAAIAEVTTSIIAFAVAGETGPADLAHLSPVLGWGLAFVVQGATVALTGRTLGDIIVNVRYAPTARSFPLQRALRFFGGIGGYQLLTVPALQATGLSWLSSAYALVLIVWVFATRDRSGLAGRLSQQRVVDAFTNNS